MNASAVGRRTTRAAYGPRPLVLASRYPLPTIFTAAARSLDIPTVCHSLDQALEALDKDREFLKAGGVFTDDFIDGYIALKMQEVTKFRAATHPLEYQMYYAN